MPDVKDKKKILTRATILMHQNVPPPEGSLIKTLAQKNKSATIEKSFNMVIAPARTGKDNKSKIAVRT